MLESKISYIFSMPRIVKSESMRFDVSRNMFVSVAMEATFLVCVCVTRVFWTLLDGILASTVFSIL